MSTHPSPNKKKSALERLREEITIDAMRHVFEEILAQSGRSATEADSWPKVLVQIRISRADTRDGVSESPARQLRIIAKYCVEYGFQPWEMCFEAQSGSLTDRYPRRKFEAFRQQIEAAQLDVAAVITYNIDRFTRDRFIGEHWLQTLMRRGVDLHEADEGEPPLPLARKEAEYAAKIFAAWRESNRTSKRIQDTQRESVRQNRLLSDVNHFGHKPVWGMRDGRKRQLRGVIVPAEAELLREASARIDAGEALYAVVVDFNERGVRGRKGGMCNRRLMRDLLISPRMIGKQTLQGEIVDAPIEPILTEQQWERNRELLLETRPRKQPSIYPVSNLGQCASCGSDITASTAKHGERHYYRCSRKHLRNRRRCWCDLSDGRRCRCQRGNSFDGLPHASRAGEPLERFLIEIALAAHDAGRVAEHAAAAFGGLRSGDSQEAELRAQLDDLDRTRRVLAQQQRNGFVTEDEVNEELPRIVAECNEIREALRVAASRNRDRTFDVDADTLRERVQTEGAAFARILVRRVIDHYILHPGTRKGANCPPYDGIEVVFVPGYEVPVEAVEALREELSEEWRRQQRLSMTGQCGTPPREDEDLAYSLWEQGKTSLDIARTFNELGRPTPRGGPEWTSAVVTGAVKRACERRGVPYEARVNTRTKYPAETRNVVYELCRERRPIAAVIDDLHRMGVHRWNGELWTPGTLHSCYASECARRGESKVGRKTFLPDSMRRRIRVMARGEGRSYADVARWLNANGVPRPCGKPWGSDDVRQVVHAEEAAIRKALDGDTPNEPEHPPSGGSAPRP